jgi:FlgD Ig-like domain
MIKILVSILVLLIYSSTYSQEYKELPSSKSQYTAQQDSAYQKALRDRLPNQLLIYEALSLLDYTKYLQRLSKDNPWRIAKATLAEIPSDYYLPSGTEIVQHQLAIIASQYVYEVPSFQSGGIKIPMSTVGKMFGFTEDLSPIIKYSLDHHSDVEIVIYSVGAVVIATIFHGPQAPGFYKRTWNFRDDDGKKMPSGDYIAEVRIGSERFLRKRILIP